MDTGTSRAGGGVDARARARRLRVPSGWWSVAAVGMTLAGCGGGESERAETIPAAPKTTPRAPADPDREAGPAGRGGSTGGASPAQDTRAGRVTDAIAGLPLARRLALVSHATRLTFDHLGLRDLRVRTSRGGRSVTAILTAAQACRATPRTAQLVTQKLRVNMPYVASLRIVVGEDAQPLDEYVRRHCRTAALPASGPGRVVLTRTGSGIATTTPFTVRSKRWTIEYVNHARFLQVIPLKGGSIADVGVTAGKRGFGRQAVSGPGRYRLKVASAGEWTVRVRDGA